MNNDKIYHRLYNDILASIHEDVYILNQWDSANDIIGPFERMRWKYYGDGARVSKNCKKYRACYFLDFKIPISLHKNKLSFCSYEGSAGLNLLDFIDSVIHGSPEKFIKYENLVVKDARKYLFEVVSLTVNDSEIDDNFIKTVKKYFHKLERIEFEKCVIKKDCNFNSVELPMKFTDCSIENIRSFNDCKADITLYGTSIEKIFPTTIHFQKINIRRYSNNIDIKNLFLQCSFPELLELSVDPAPEKRYSNYSFEDSFTYLPYSAPNLEDLTIQGKVRSLNFLTQFKHLLECRILSIQDDLGLGYASVTDSIEKEKIFARNKKEYEIEKILYPEKDDKYIIGDLEKRRILKLCHFLSLLNYEEEDKGILKNSNLIEFLLNKPIDLDVERYYECYFDTLYSKKQKSDFFAQLDYEDKYKIMDNILYRYNPPENQGQIVRAKNFIYGPNGIPILFKGYKKPIRTLEEALKKIESSDEHNLRSFNLDDYCYQQFINELKNFHLDDSISIGAFIDGIEEVCGIKVSGKDFLSFGEAGKKLFSLFEQCDRGNKRLDDLKEKQFAYKMLFTKLIHDKYELFSVPEKSYLVMHRYDFDISGIRRSVNPNFLNIYQTLVPDEDIIFTSIDMKTDGLYSNYVRHIKTIYQQYYILDNPYDIEIDSECIKQLQFK